MPGWARSASSTTRSRRRADEQRHGVRPVKRYGHAGPIYDALSLEAVLYRRPRHRLSQLFGTMPGATIVDVGCGTGLNLPWLVRAVSPGGRVIGIDDSPSMLTAAERRCRHHNLLGVTIRHGDATHLHELLRHSEIVPDGIVATFVLSLLTDDTAFWTALDEIATSQPLRVAIADLGTPDTAPRALRPALRLLTRAGGSEPAQRPWDHLIRHTPDARHESHIGGHVHLAIGTYLPT